MTQVDFYILQNAQIANTEQFTCLLAEKAFKKGHTVHIQTNNAQQTERMDKLMWTYNDMSFLPHVMMGDVLQEDTPIHISHNSESASITDVLINLRSEVPMFYEQFNRVAEIVSADPQQRQLARQRYRQYKTQGLEVTSHDVNR